MTLSAWAADRTHRALGSTTDKAARLAIALGSVRALIRVVDRHLPPMDVNWARVDEEAVIRSMSFSDLRGGKMHINPTPISDGRLDHGAALDICSGFGLHEASHSQESRDRYEALLTPVEFRREVGRDVPSREVPAFEPMRVAAYLWNVVEDVRIEQVTAGHWPGFAPYFGAVLDYMWTDMSEHHELPVVYGPDVAAKLKTVFLSCRYPVEAAKLPVEMQPEVAWWTAWQHDYLSDRVDTAATIRAGLAHLGDDKETAKELQSLAEAERKERERGEKVRAQIERLIREGMPGTYGVCITSSGEVVPLDAETAAEVDQLVRENLVEHRTIIRAVGAANPPIRVRKPEETQESRRAYVGRPDALTQALRAALVFRNSAPQHDIKLLKAGTLDDAELYRWGMGDYRVFSEHVVEAKPDVFMALLVDASGSMSGRKLQIAQRLAQQLVWTTHDQEMIETAVWAHTGDLNHDAAAEIFRIYEKGDPLSRLGIITTLDRGNNYDGAANSWVASVIAEKPQPVKVLIVLSDGLPSGTGYGGAPAANHVRQVGRWAASRGVDIWQLAIDPFGIEAADQEAMYPGAWLPYRSDAELPRQLGQLMARFV